MPKTQRKANCALRRKMPMKSAKPSPRHRPRAGPIRERSSSAGYAENIPKACRGAMVPSIGVRHGAHPTPRSRPRRTRRFRDTANCCSWPRMRCAGTGQDCRNLRAAIQEFVRSEDEQARGDALAALMQIVRAHVDSQDDAIAADQCEEEIRRHLTASGVPYVPEEVRRLPEKWRKINSGHGEYKVASRKAIDQCTRELEAALAAAPAVCEWTPDDKSDETPVWVIVNQPGLVPFRKRPIRQTNEAVAELLIALYENHPDATCTVLYMHPHGPEPESGREWLSIHSAAAPTDGREHDGD